MSVNRRLVLMDPAGQLYPQMGVIELGDQPNANAASPLSVAVQQQCDLGGWHTTESEPLPCWSSEVAAKCAHSGKAY